MRILIIAAITAGLALLAGCGQQPVRVQLEVVAQGAGGGPVPGAEVVVGGRPVGATDGEGRLVLEERRLPGEEVAVVVRAPRPSSSTWEGRFVVRRTQGGAPDVVALVARLEAPSAGTRVAAKAKREPQREPGVDAAGPAPQAKPGGAAEAAGPTAAAGTKAETDAKGRSAAEPAATGRPARRPAAAARADAGAGDGAGPNTKPAAGGGFTVRALTEEYGTRRGVAGIQVYVDGQRVATTDREGIARIALPAGGRPVRLTLASDDYLPTRWSTDVGPGARRRGELRRFFYPVTPPQIRVGLVGYRASVGVGPDLADAIDRLDESLADHLFDRPAFVPVADLGRKLDFLKLTVDALTQRGWEQTPLRSQLDLLVVGSVAGETTPDAPLTIETRVYTASGRLLLAHVKAAKDLKRPRDLTRELADEIVARFPFEGTVLEALPDGRLRINLGSGGGRGIEAGTPFHLFIAEADAEGRVTGRREVGVGTVTRVEPLVAEIKPESLAPGVVLGVGDRVVRALVDDPTVGATGAVALRVRSEGRGEPVAAANVYLDGAWVGTTDRDGRLEVPVRPRRRYDLLVFKHGFQQARETVSFPQAAGERIVTLVPAEARFTVESVPSGALVTVDGEEVGRTPIAEPVAVRLGFRRVRIDAGGDWRAYERVVEFAGPELALTGPNRIVLEKDWLAIGERLLAEGRPTEAMEALAKAGPGHPDYSAARHRLGQLYLDEKKDPEAAIREFERVLAVPENREVVRKRFAVVYTNLGHAYYALGVAIQRKDPEGAARAYRKALEALGIARQNSRFFPGSSYDEALHDTYYYTALAQHRLADLSRSPEAFRRADLAWRDYFDFFPKRLEGNPAFERTRQGAEQFWAEARRKAS